MTMLEKIAPDENLVQAMLIAYIEGREGRRIANFGVTPKDENGMRNVLAMLTERGYKRADLAQPTDAEAQIKRANELLDRIDIQCRAVGHPVGGIDELKHIVTSALQRPAVDLGMFVYWTKDKLHEALRRSEFAESVELPVEQYRELLEIACNHLEAQGVENG